MRTMFPGHFRPTGPEFEAIWSDCIFAVDANVLLNLYRYSADTRLELVKALDSIKMRVFLPHQAAKEFLRSRLGVTAGQAEEYSKAIKVVKELLETLSNKKKHPFLPDAELPKFEALATSLCGQLEAQKSAVLQRLVSDEILDYAVDLFTAKTGTAFDGTRLKAVETEGLQRYQNEIPPGYRDGKKDGSGDLSRKFGDLIVWKQIIEKAKAETKPFIFITDDKKEDWWLEQSGRTIGPRPELVDEFWSETGQRFWMYTVDKFLEEVAKANNVPVNRAVIAEIIEVSEDARQEAAALDAEEHVSSVKRQANVAFMKALVPSDALAEIVGSDPLPRTEVVSKLWSYIKKNGLQNRAQPRQINADDKLFAIFGKSNVSMFEMAGLIGKHLR